MRRIVSLLLAVLLLAAAATAAGDAGPEAVSVDTRVSDIQKFGNMMLDVKASELQAKGIDVGDIVTVTLNHKAYDMPVVGDFPDVDQGSFLCRLVNNSETGEDDVLIAINLGDLATWAGIATRESVSKDPGYAWRLNQGVPDPVPVTLTLKEKGGYNDELSLHRLVSSNKREDYPNLDDEAYANFREVTTTGMGKHALYRSASPVSPELNRNREADAAAGKAGIRTFINMTDSEQDMKAYEGFADTYYSRQHIICLNMVLDFQADDFRQGLAKGFTYMAEQEGPFLIHCNAGKDRAGFASAVLEALMGADAGGIVKDYMISYYNFYGVEPGTEMYTKIAEANILKTLPQAFGLASLEGADLQAAAENYLGRDY